MTTIPFGGLVLLALGLWALVGQIRSERRGAPWAK